MLVHFPMLPSPVLEKRTRSMTQFLQDWIENMGVSSNTCVQACKSQCLSTLASATRGPLIEHVHHEVGCILLLNSDHTCCFRLKHVRGSRSLHSASVWKPQQEKRHKRNIHSLHVCHRYKQHPVCVWCCYRCHYQEQPQGLRTVLNFTRPSPWWASVLFVTHRL